MIVVWEDDRNFVYPFANPLSLHQLYECTNSMHPIRNPLSASTLSADVLKYTRM